MSLNVLEKQRWATRIAFPITALGDAIGNFRDFEDGIDFGTDFL